MTNIPAIPQNPCKACAGRDKIIDALAEEIDRLHREVMMLNKQVHLVEEIAHEDFSEVAA